MQNYSIVDFHTTDYKYRYSFVFPFSLFGENIVFLFVALSQVLCAETQLKATENINNYYCPLNIFLLKKKD
jgi:hypothetical protein